MITRAKISAVRASGGAALIRGRRLLTFLSQMRRLFEGGAYSNKYDTHKNHRQTLQSAVLWKEIPSKGKVFKNTIVCSGRFPRHTTIQNTIFANKHQAERFQDKKGIRRKIIQQKNCPRENCS